MEKRAVKRAMQAARSFLGPDERVDHVCRLRLKSSDHSATAKNAASVAAGVAAASLTGFGMMRFTVPRTFCLLLTDRRLLFLDVSSKNAQPLPSVAGQIPRGEVRARRIPSFPSGKLALDGPNGELVTLVFPLGVRLDGSNLLKALGQPELPPR